MAALSKFISLQEAAQILGITDVELRRLVEVDKIRAVMLGEGEIAVNEADVRALVPAPKETLPEYQAVKHLKGVPIWLREAERKYGIGSFTLGEWLHKGFINQLGMDGNKVLVDEADVAYCKSIYERIGGGQGKRIFNGDGTPFTPKPPRRKPRMTSAAIIALDPA
jgi:excisionase family DNA binding protein